MTAKERKELIQHYTDCYNDLKEDCNEQMEYVEDLIGKMNYIIDPLIPLKDRLEKGIKKEFNKSIVIRDTYKRMIKKLKGSEGDIKWIEKKVNELQ